MDTIDPWRYHSNRAATTLEMRKYIFHTPEIKMNSKKGLYEQVGLHTRHLIQLHGARCYDYQPRQNDLAALEESRRMQREGKLRMAGSRCTKCLLCLIDPFA